MPQATITINSERGQFILVLLAALVELSDHIPSKAEVETHIEKAEYLKLTSELLKQAYASKTEAKWKTLLAFARQDALDRGLLKPPVVRGTWEISAKGLERLARFEQYFKDGKAAGKRFEFLSDAFLRRMGA
jgi:Mrr N-terminal domain